MARKNIRNEYAVIGLGRFGTAVALTLQEKGHNVLGIDRRQDIVQQLADQIPRVVAFDSTDEDALRAVDIASFETVVVSIGTNFENNLLTTVALKSLQVKRVVCKAQSTRQQNILLRVGADLVVLPEHEAGQRLAWRLTEPQVLDHLNLGEGFSVAELPVPRHLIGQSLAQSDLRRRYGINVLAVRRGPGLLVTPPPDLFFTHGDSLLVIGSDLNISDFCATRP